jgi:hypothetical protein
MINISFDAAAATTTATTTAILLLQTHRLLQSKISVTPLSSFYLWNSAGKTEVVSPQYSRIPGSTRMNHTLGTGMES